MAVAEFVLGMLVVFFILSLFAWAGMDTNEMLADWKSPTVSAALLVVIWWFSQRTGTDKNGKKAIPMQEDM